MTRRKVVQMTSVHTPFDVRIYHKECRSLVRAGHDVTLIAPCSALRDDDYGIKMHAVQPPSNRRERVTKTIRDVYRAALEEDADIYHFHDPELIPIAMLLKLRGKKVIYDVHEDHPSNVRKQWIPPALQGLASLAIRTTEATMGRACDRVIAATPTIASRFPASTTSVVQNFPWTDEFTQEHGTPHAEREAVIAYVGYLGDVRGLREMSEAIRLVNAELPARLALAGKLFNGAQRNGYHGNAQIDMLGPLDRHQIKQLLLRSRIGIVVYHPTPNYYYGQPTKLLEYMAAGLPVVASDFPFYRQVIDSSQCGLLVDPLQPAKIAEALLWLLRNPERSQDMGRRGQQAVFERYNWEQEAKRLISTYDAL